MTFAVFISNYYYCSILQNVLVILTHLLVVLRSAFFRGQLRALNFESRPKVTGRREFLFANVYAASIL